MPDRKRKWWIILLVALALLAPAAAVGFSFYTFSGEHQDEICVPYSSDDDTNLALNASFKSAGTVRIASWNGLFTNRNSNLTAGAQEISGTPMSSVCRRWDAKTTAIQSNAACRASV